MYTTINFKTKKALKQAVADGERISVFQAGGIFPTVDTPGRTVYLEGPHFPQPHRWYASAVLGDDRCIDKVK